MKINSIFRSIQGEGPFTGRSSLFLRVYGCNLAEDCPIQCDTPYTWKGNDYEELGIDALISNLTHRLKNKEGDLIVITGGEPMLYSDEIDKLIVRLYKRNVYPDIQIETNGTILPTSNWNSVTYVISPKTEIDYQSWKKFHDIHFKFVCEDPNDIDAIEEIVKSEELNKGKIWIMPEGATRDTLNSRRQEIVEKVLEKGYNYSDRLQIMTWGNRRCT